MKSRIVAMWLAVVAGIVFWGHCSINVAAENPASAATNPSPTQTSSPSPQTAPVELPKSVVDVLQLVRAKISDDTIVAFIETSGASYPLNTAAILYLHGEGVSDRVLAAMLEPHRKGTQPASRPAPTTNYSPANTAQKATTEVPQPATAVQNAPTYPASSTVYVAPSAPTYVYSYGYYPYSYYPSYYYPSYSGYYGYGYPALSFSFGYGSYSHGCGYHGGGYYGGGYYGGHHH